MNNNCEINTYKYSYIYKMNKPTSHTLIFELILNNFNKSITKRCIQKTINGELISEADNIFYNQYTHFDLTIMDADNINNIIIIKDNIMKDNLSTVINSDKIYLEINKLKNNLMTFNYCIYN
jgi:hypothetical protein